MPSSRLMILTRHCMVLVVMGGICVFLVLSETILLYSESASVGST